MHTLWDLPHSEYWAMWKIDFLNVETIAYVYTVEMSPFAQYVRKLDQLARQLLKICWQFAILSRDTVYHIHTKGHGL